MAEGLIFSLPWNYFKVVLANGTKIADHFDTKKKAKAYRDKVGKGAMVKRGPHHPKGETF